MIWALGWSLLHFVWQGAGAAAALAMLNLVVKRANPQVRYLLASGTLALMLLLPVLTFQRLRGEAEPAGDTPALGITVRRGGEFRSGSVGELLAPEKMRRHIEPQLPVLVLLWGAGVLVLSLRAAGGWVAVQRLRQGGQASTPAVEEMLARLLRSLRMSAPVHLYQSARVQVPTVIGWLRPVILLPASALTGLTPAQLELILAHELAHIRRWDYLVNLLQTAAETLLFYHPAVWWVSHRMRVEREHCCDDLAVAAGGNAVHYARALADLEGLCSDAPALGVAATGGSLFERIARLLGHPPHLSRTSRSLAAALTFSSLSLALGVGSSLLNSPATPVARASAFLGPQAPAPSPTPTVGEDPRPRKAAPEPKAAPQAAPQPKAVPQAAPVHGSEERGFPLERVLELARAGVTPEYIAQMDSLGYPSLSVDQLLALRSQGVGPEYIRGLKAEGYQDLSPDQLQALRAQGVSVHYIRGLKEQGLTRLSIGTLVELRAQGVSPEYIAELKQAGYSNLGPSELVALRSQGIGGRFAQELQALGYEKLSLTKLIALRSQGISPEYVREMAALGYRGLDIPVLLGLRSQGVSPNYVRRLKEAGYADLPPGLLIELRSRGVTPEFIRELKEAGLDNLKPEELIELRSRGIRGELLKRLKGRL